MNIRSVALLTCCILFGASGCMKSSYTSGRPIAEDKVNQITDGVTTTEQILSWFGAPTSTTTLGDNILYVYRFTKTSGSGVYVPYYAQNNSKESTNELTITFDRVTGKVKAHSFQQGISKG